MHFKVTYNIRNIRDAESSHTFACEVQAFPRGRNVVSLKRVPNSSKGAFYTKLGADALESFCGAGQDRADVYHYQQIGHPQRKTMDPQWWEEVRKGGSESIVNGQIWAEKCQVAEWTSLGQVQLGDGRSDIAELPT